MSSRSILKKIDQWSFAKIEAIRSSAISLWYDDLIDGLDQKSKKTVSALTHTVIATSPLIFSLILFIVVLFFSGVIDTQKNQISSIDNIIKMETQLKNALLPITKESSVTSPSSFMNTLKMKMPGNKSFLKKVVINSVDIEPGKGSISILRGKLSFNGIGISELKNIINTLQNKMMAGLYEITVSVDKDTDLLRGNFEIEMRVK